MITNIVKRIVPKFLEIAVQPNSDTWQIKLLRKELRRLRIFQQITAVALMVTFVIAWMGWSRPASPPQPEPVANSAPLQMLGNGDYYLPGTLWTDQLIIPLRHPQAADMQRGLTLGFWGPEKDLANSGTGLRLYDEQGNVRIEARHRMDMQHYWLRVAAAEEVATIPAPFARFWDSNYYSVTEIPDDEF